ncbi:MAG: EAL domain-containing protein, partial [Rhodospirillaceae bacterium]
FWKILYLVGVCVKPIGMRLSIDDFGTGYSSLVQLQRLPFSELKIDRALVADCAVSKQSKIIVKSAIDLAHNLGLTACAEGIETAAALDVISQLGCDFAQGYHISRPMYPEQVKPWLFNETGNANT